MSTSHALATPADVEVANDIAWSMALEGRALSEKAFERLLSQVVADRAAREQKHP